MDHGIVPFDVAFVGDDADPTLVVQGDLDAASAPALVDAAAAHRPLQRLTVDTSKLSFVDSAGLRALLAVREMVSADGGAPPRLANVSGDLRRLLEICGLVDAFDGLD